MEARWVAISSAARDVPLQQAAQKRRGRVELVGRQVEIRAAAAPDERTNEEHQAGEAELSAPTAGWPAQAAVAEVVSHAEAHESQRYQKDRKEPPKETDECAGRNEPLCPALFHAPSQYALRLAVGADEVLQEDAVGVTGLIDDAVLERRRAGQD